MLAPDVTTIEVNSVRRPYDVEIVPEIVDGELVFVARHPALRGCMTHGATPEEALTNLDEVRATYLHALQSAGVKSPPTKAHPTTSMVVPLGTARTNDPQRRQSPWKLSVDVTGRI